MGICAGGFPCSLNPSFAGRQEGPGTVFLFERKDLRSAFWHIALHLHPSPQWHQDHQAHQMVVLSMPLSHEPQKLVLPT